MSGFNKGDRIRVDIPGETDPDHQEFHGKHDQIVLVMNDDADSITAETRDGTLYRVKLDSGETADFRWRDLWAADRRFIAVALWRSSPSNDELLRRGVNTQNAKTSPKGGIL